MISFLSILAMGFFLGMRHATDPDHVIAVTTIVSNQSKNLRAVLIAAFWGVGHTVTLFVAGAGIIPFNLAIPDAGWAQQGVVLRSNAEHPGLNECTRVSALDAWQINPQS
jgi:hypothetical protein